MRSLSFVTIFSCYEVTDGIILEVSELFHEKLKMAIVEALRDVRLIVSQRDK